MKYKLRLYGIDTKALIGEWEVEAVEECPETWAQHCADMGGRALWIDRDTYPERVERWPGEAVYGNGATRDKPHRWLFGNIPWSDGPALIETHGGLGVDWEPSEPH